MRGLKLILALGLVAAAVNVAAAATEHKGIDYWAYGKPTWNPCKGTALCTSQRNRQVDALFAKMAADMRKLQAALTAEKNARIAADNAAASALKTVADNLAAEAAARAAADQKLTDDLAAEAAARAAADQKLTDDLAAEAAARLAADDAEKTARAAADQKLTNDLATEASARIAADTAEATARTNADQKLADDLAAEAAARLAADDAEKTAREAADAAEAAARLAADNAEKAAREAADAAIIAVLPTGSAYAPNAAAQLSNLNNGGELSNVLVQAINFGGTPTTGDEFVQITVYFDVTAEINTAQFISYSDLTNGAITALSPLGVSGASAAIARCGIVMGAPGGAISPAGSTQNNDQAFNAYLQAGFQGITLLTDRTGFIGNFDNSDNVWPLSQASCTFVAKLA